MDGSNSVIAAYVQGFYEELKTKYQRHHISKSACIDSWIIDGHCECIDKVVRWYELIFKDDCVALETNNDSLIIKKGTLEYGDPKLFEKICAFVEYAMKL
jgi:hypothetical protein